MRRTLQEQVLRLLLYATLPKKTKEAIEMGYRLYTNADELLADPEVNTVILTVPNYLHKEMCIKAAKAGERIPKSPLP